MGKIQDFFDRLQADLSDEYIKNAYVLAAIFGVVFFVLFLVMAIKQKKARGFGIASGILQLLGALGAAMNVIGFHSSEFFAVVKGTGSTQEEAEEALKDAMASKLVDMLSGQVPMIIGSILVLIAWIFGLIYIVKLKSEIMKGFSIPALILHILRFVFVSPVAVSFMNIINSVEVTQESQASHDYLFYGACALPYILLFIGALIGKKKSEEVVATIEGMAVEATPIATATPVVEVAPVVEAAPVEAQTGNDINN